MSETAISKTITYAAFFFAIIIIGISVISVIFPALIITQTYDYSLDLNPFETSPWLTPILFSSISVLIIGFLYYTKKLPYNIDSAIDRIFNFELSKRVAIIVGISILAIYVGLSIPELFIDELTQWPDYRVLEEGLKIWPSTDTFSVYVKEQNTRYVRMFLLDVSQDIFQNIKLSLIF